VGRDNHLHHVLDLQGPPPAPGHQPA
jgi:hypothetical protein